MVRVSEPGHEPPAVVTVFSIFSSGGQMLCICLILKGMVCLPLGMASGGSTGSAPSTQVSHASVSSACRLPVGLLPGSQNSFTSMRTTTFSSRSRSSSFTVPCSSDFDVNNGPVRCSYVSVAVLPPSSMIPSSTLFSPVIRSSILSSFTRTSTMSPMATPD